MTTDPWTVVEGLRAALAGPDGDLPEVRTTHGSVVLLTRDRAYKLKRPVSLGFLDYGTLARRRVACEAEVALNGPRAPGVYRAVHAVTRDAAGRHRLGGPGEPVEWVVEMERLPDDACLLHRVEAGAVPAALLERIGRSLADHHAAARRGPAVSRWAAPEVVRRHALDNLDAAAGEAALPAALADRLRARLVAELDAQGDRLARRARARACDTHGDLRLDHVYALPGDRLVFVDGVEFSEEYRFADPVSDVAFLTMDLGVRGLDALADAAAAGWFGRSGDEDGRPLLPLYESYRSAVRGKVAGIVAAGAEVPDGARRDALDRARRHWVYALGALASPADRPALVGVGGLPGTGKTTLARGLASALGFTLVRSDVVRKEDGAAPDYSEAGKDAVYARCFARAAEGVAAGGRVVVDASFAQERWRRGLADLGRALGVPAVVLEVRAPPELVRQRLAARSGDASDADVAVYERARAAWAPGGATPIDATDAGAALAAASAALAAAFAPPARFRPGDLAR